MVYMHHHQQLSVQDPKLRQFQKFIAVEGLLSFALSTLRFLRVEISQNEKGEARNVPQVSAGREHFIRGGSGSESAGNLAVEIVIRPAE